MGEGIESFGGGWLEPFFKCANSLYNQLRQMSRRRRNQREEEESKSHSEAEEVRIHEDEPAQIQDEGEGEDLEDNASRDYENIEELDQYENDGVDEEEVSQDLEARRRANEAMDQRDRIQRRRDPRRQGPDVEEFMEDELDYDIQQRRQMYFQEDDDEDQEMDERRYLDAEESRGKLQYWIQEEETVKYIKSKFRKFIRTFQGTHSYPIYASALREMCALNTQSIEISYNDIKNTNPTLATWIAFEPMIIFPYLNRTAYQLAWKQYPAYANIHPQVFVKIKDLPIKDNLRELRHSHLNKLINIVGVITKRNQVLNQLKRITCRCQRCGEIQGPFYASSLSEINFGTCNSCQSKGPFYIDKEKTIYRNYQTITVQELPHDVPPGRIPRQKDVILLGDNIDIARPGDAVQIIGVYMNKYSLNLNIKQGFPVFNTIIEANSIKRMEETEYDNDETKKDMEEAYRQLAKRPDLDQDIINSIAPSIYGHEDVKMALALALFGGVERTFEDTHRVRGDINVLILGDPGTAKSQFLKSIQKIFARCIYTTGKGASGVGLTASVKKDHGTGDWVLEAGALVLADKGICLIDEFDKMNEYDRTSIHEAMEQQSISISKAGIVTSLRARCSVIAAANPISGTYRPDKAFKDNVDLSDPILSRFDILCVVKDDVNEEIDHYLSTFVVNSHIKNHPTNQLFAKTNELNHTEVYKIETLPEPPNQSNPIDLHLLKNYIKYAREKCKPTLSNQNNDLIKDFYLKLREQAQKTSGIHIAVRHIQSLIRMSTARAKMFLRNEVKKQDVQTAIRVMLNSFIQTQKHSVAKLIQGKFRQFAG